MAAKKGKRPPTQPSTTTSRVEDAATARALDDHGSAIRELEAQRRARVTFRADLLVGDNTLLHHLGRTASGYTITPTVADAGFAHALKAADDKTITITVVGVAQPGAIVEVFAEKSVGQQAAGSGGGVS